MISGGRRVGENNFRMYEAHGAVLQNETVDNGSMNEHEPHAVIGGPEIDNEPVPASPPLTDDEEVEDPHGIFSPMLPEGTAADLSVEGMSASSTGSFVRGGEVSRRGKKRTSRQQAEDLAGGEALLELQTRYSALFAEGIDYNSWTKRFRELAAGDDDALFLSLFVHTVELRRVIPEQFSRHIFTHLNSELHSARFLESGAVDVARASASCYAWVMRMFDSYELGGAKMELVNSDGAACGSVHILPLVESARWRQLFIENVIKNQRQQVAIGSECLPIIMQVSEAVEKEQPRMLKGRFGEAVRYLREWGLPRLVKKVTNVMKKFSQKTDALASLPDYLSAYEFLGKKKALTKTQEGFSNYLEQKINESPADFIAYAEAVLESVSIPSKKIIARVLLKKFNTVCRGTLRDVELHKKLCSILQSLSGLLKYFNLGLLQGLTREEVQIFMLLFQGQSKYLNMAGKESEHVDGELINEVLAALSPDLEEIRISRAPSFVDQHLQLLTARCPRLKILELIETSVTDLNCLSRLENLQVLRMPRSSRLRIATLPPLNVVQADFSFSPIDEYAPFERLRLLQSLMLRGEESLDIDALFGLEARFENLDISGKRKFSYSKRRSRETPKRYVTMQHAVLNQKQKGELGDRYPTYEFYFDKGKN